MEKWEVHINSLNWNSSLRIPPNWGFGIHSNPSPSPLKKIQIRGN